MRAKLLLALLAAVMLAAGVALEMTREPPVEAELSEYVMTYKRVTSDGKLTEENTYDERGNILTSLSNKWYYDERGNCIREEHYAYTAGAERYKTLENCTEYDYDRKNRLAERREYDSVALEYDGSGTLIGVEPVLSKTWCYEYNGDETHIEIYNADGVRTSGGIMRYDEQGRLILAQDINTDGSVWYEERYVFSEGENFTCEEQYRSYGGEPELCFREKHVYDENGRETLTVHFDSLLGDYSVEHAYDENGNLVEKAHRDNRDRIWRVETFTHDEQGRVSTHRSTYLYPQAWKEGVACISFVEDPRKAYGRGHDYAYNDDGLLAEMTTLNQWGFPESTTTYTYDDFGNCIREEIVDSESNVTKIIEMEYTKVR